MMLYLVVGVAVGIVAFYAYLVMTAKADPYEEHNGSAELAEDEEPATRVPAPLAGYGLRQA